MSNTASNTLYDRHYQSPPNSYSLAEVVSKFDKTVHTDTKVDGHSEDEHDGDTQEQLKEQDSSIHTKQVDCNDSVLNMNEQTDLHLMQPYQESYPSGNQKIEESNLGYHFEYNNQDPCSELSSNTIIDAKIDNSFDNEKVETETENERKEDESENERNYQVVLVSDKDLIAKEFRGVLMEKLDDHQSVKKSSNIKDKYTAQNCETVSITREVEGSGSCGSKKGSDSVISLEVCSDSNGDDISQQYLCHICGKSYKQLSHLSRHTKDAHSKEHFHQCTICETTFTRASSLIRHLKLHEQRNSSSPTIGPYKCPQCTKTFQQPYNVARHLLTHTGEKPFQCHECNKTFTQHTGLTRHLILHKGSKDFKCDVCGKEFARLFVLNRHSLTHTDDKPYKCFLCSKSFIRASQLEGHMKSHKKDDTNYNKKSMKS